MPTIRVRDLRRSYGTVRLRPRTTGLGFNGGDRRRLFAWTVAGSLLAGRFFRWDSVKT